MTQRSRDCSLAVLFGVALLTSACGGTSQPKVPPAPAKTAPASAIEQRLRKAGYSISETGGRSPLINGPANVLPVGELANFSVKADFTSPDSFTLDIAVFASHEDLVQTAARQAAARRRAVRLCAQIPQCRAFRRSRTSVASPTLVQQTATKVVGSVLYTAVEDSPAGKLPLPMFERLVALASGTPG
ncbi:MAG TPA: hypothetical protein VGL76_02940 [Gaiellaceae bacterium]